MEKRKEKEGRAGGGKEGARRKERKWKKKKKRRMNMRNITASYQIFIFFKKNLKRKDSGMHAHEMAQDLNDMTKLLTTKHEEN